MCTITLYVYRHVIWVCAHGRREPDNRRERTEKNIKRARFAGPGRRTVCAVEMLSRVCTAAGTHFVACCVRYDGFSYTTARFCRHTRARASKRYRWRRRQWFLLIFVDFCWFSSSTDSSLQSVRVFGRVEGERQRVFAWSSGLFFDGTSFRRPRSIVFVGFWLKRSRNVVVELVFFNNFKSPEHLIREKFNPSRNSVVRTNHDLVEDV